MRWVHSIGAVKPAHALRYWRYSLQHDGRSSDYLAPGVQPRRYAGRCVSADRWVDSFPESKHQCRVAGHAGRNNSESVNYFRVSAMGDASSDADFCEGSDEWLLALGWHESLCGWHGLAGSRYYEF